MSNPILKKELHLLKGPGLAAIGLLAMILMTYGMVNPYYLPSTSWVLGLFALLLCYTITSAFGHEISEGSLGLWLVQPAPRGKLWDDKFKITLLAYAGMGLSIGLVALLLDSRRPTGSQIESMSVGMLWIGWTCFGPGIYYTLKLRNPVASFWLTGVASILLAVLIAIALMPVTWFFPEFPEVILSAVNWTCCMLYGGLGIWAARREFLRWEDLGTSGKVLDFRMRPSKSASPTSERRRRRTQSPHWSMLIRELRLQQINVLIGCLLLGAIWITYNWSQFMSVTNGAQRDQQRLIALLPITFRYLLFILPCSIAAVSIAEGRRQDVHTWELMLPVSRRFQFGLKAFCSLFLGWLFAAGLPMIFDANVTLAGHDPEQRIISLVLSNISAVIIGTLSLYFSSLTSGFLKSFSFSLSLLPLLVLFWAFQNHLAIFEISRFLGWFVVPVVILACMVPFLIIWSLENYKAPQILGHHKKLNWKRWGYMTTVILLWLSIMIDRSWERVLLREPRPAAKNLQASLKGLDHWRRENLFESVESDANGVERVQVKPYLGGHHGTSAISLLPDGQLHVFASIYMFGSYEERVSSTLTPPRRITRSVLLPDSSSSEPASAAAAQATTHHRFILDAEAHLWKWDFRTERRFTEQLLSPEFQNPLGAEPVLHHKRFRNLRCGNGAVAVIDEDHILWMSQYEMQGRNYSNALPELQSVYDNHRWKDLWLKGQVGLGLKEDGTLWTWGGKVNWFKIGLDTESNDDPEQVLRFKKWKSFEIGELFLLLGNRD